VSPEAADPPLSVVRPLLRARQVRDFTEAPVSDADVDAITEVARWTGSSSNEQPWRFIVVRDPASLRALHDAGLPSTRSLETAQAAIAIVTPANPERQLWHAFDEGRAAERMLVAAGMLGLGAAITLTWKNEASRVAIRSILHVPDDWNARVMVVLGYPTDAARLSKSPPGEARRPRTDAVFDESWPAEEA
jgi:nitroreductase